MCFQIFWTFFFFFFFFVFRALSIRPGSWLFWLVFLFTETSPALFSFGDIVRFSQMFRCFASCDLSSCVLVFEVLQCLLPSTTVFFAFHTFNQLWLFDCNDFSIRRRCSRFSYTRLPVSLFSPSIPSIRMMISWWTMLVRSSGSSGQFHSFSWSSCRFTFHHLANPLVLVPARFFLVRSYRVHTCRLTHHRRSLILVTNHTLYRSARSTPAVRTSPRSCSSSSLLFCARHNSFIHNCGSPSFAFFRRVSRHLIRHTLSLTHSLTYTHTLVHMHFAP